MTRKELKVLMDEASEGVSLEDTIIVSPAVYRALAVENYLERGGTSSYSMDDELYWHAIQVRVDKEHIYE